MTFTPISPSGFLRLLCFAICFCASSYRRTGRSHRYAFDGDHLVEADNSEFDDDQEIAQSLATLQGGLLCEGKVMIYT